MQPALDPDFFHLLISSHLRLVGTPLLPAEVAVDDALRWLYQDAPFCVLAHNTAADPRFVYANLAAQRCFEYSWEEMTALPSRLSAEAPNREERQRLLESVSQKGRADGYRGLRIDRKSVV